MRGHAKAPSAGSTHARTTGTTGRFTLALLAALAAALLLSASASAAFATPDGTFNGSGSAAEPLAPNKLAVDQATGDVYVIDKAAGALNRFDSEGNYLSQITGITFGGEEADVAVDNSATATQGNVYVVTEVPSQILAFGPSDSGNAPLWQSSQNLAVTCGVAVDSDGNPWTSDFNKGVQQRDPATGAAVGSPVATDHSAGPISQSLNCAIAFDPADNLYVNQWHSVTYKYFAADYTTSASTLDAATNYDVGADLATGNVLAVHSEEVAVYDSSGAVVAETPFATGSSGLIGATVDGPHGRAFVSDPANSQVLEFDLAAAATPTPYARTGAASNITETAADIAGMVNPNGASSFCAIKYSTDTSFGETQPCASAPGEGTAEVAVGASLAGLSPGTTYHYRVIAGSANGFTNGSAGTFTTDEPPKYTLSVTTSGSGTVNSTPAGIACNPTCSAEFTEGTVVTLTPVPAAHNQLSAWSGACTGSGACEVTMSEAKAVTATFAPITRTVKATVSGKGSVSASSGTISACTATSGTCEGPYNQNSSLTFTATPAAHQQIASWTGCTTTPKGATGNECKLTVPAASAEVKVAFTPITRKLTVAKAGTGSGSVTCDGGACAAEYEEGTKVTLAASAASGSSFAGFSGGGCSASPCTLTLDADTAVSASFSANPVVNPPATNPPVTPPTTNPPPKCKKGFKRKTVKGKQKCVKVKKHKRHRH